MPQPEQLERAILVGIDLPRRGNTRPNVEDTLETSAEESMEELRVLTESAGAEVVERHVQARAAASAATLIGSGKVQEVAASVQALQADVVVFDADLSPTQQRNLERALDSKVIDRTQLILDIFARRARTREGQLQVELAQLQYLLPRLTGRGAAMSRLGGGIGTRGPGETQLESDRRRIGQRITRLKKELETVRATRTVQRRARQAVPLITISLVGYTNAGKSTLFNRLTGSGVLADAKMFATLDPTVRHVILPSHRRVLLSDTVGFIRNLPTTLVQAFRATLEEVLEAGLLLHVVDASSPHAPQYTAHVLKVLAEIGAEETPQVLVLNKADLLPEGTGITEEAARRLLTHIGPAEAQGERPSRAVAISARTGEGVDRLLALMDEVLPSDPVTRHTFRFSPSEGAAVHLLHEFARVIDTRYDGEQTEIVADTPESILRRLAAHVVHS